MQAHLADLGTDDVADPRVVAVCLSFHRIVVDSVCAHVLNDPIFTRTSALLRVSHRPCLIHAKLGSSCRRTSALLRPC